MANYNDLRARTLGSTQEEEAVTVNTRALIDKVLARYSSENTTLRELIQNAADANATSVEIRYYTSPPTDHAFYDPDDLQHLSKAKVRRLLVKNNGQDFREEDWQRLKRIAEGNPDETKIGAFGVGFYSVFADTDEPFISSGSQTMAFYWKGNSLFTRRAKMDTHDPSTTFLLDYREPGELPDLKNLCQFFATSLTFVKLNSISLFVDDRELCVLNKKVSPSMSLGIPSSINPQTADKIMKVASVETSQVQLDAKYMNVTHWKPASDGPTSFVRSFFKNITAAPATASSKVITSANLGEYTTAAIFLRIATATVLTNVGRKFAQELERATKKPPPQKTVLSCLTMSKDEQDASEHESEIFANVIPSKAGRVFIGFPTHQTTSIKAHISAHSVIPTVERENIDLNARIIKSWNVEMLRIAGILSRIMYFDEMQTLGKRARGLKPSDIVPLYADAIHIMRQFTFGQSTPSNAVGAYIAEAFWSCTKYTSIELLSTQGVLPSTKVRLNSDVEFLDGLPLLPEALVEGARDFVQHLKEGGYISEITISDIQNELSDKPLTGDKTTKFLKWLAVKVRVGEIDDLQTQMLLSGAVAMVPSTGKDGKAIPDSVPVQLNTIRFFVNPSKLSSQLPLPPNCMPFSVTSTLSQSDMLGLQWNELSVVHWLSYITQNSSRLPVEQCLDKSPQFAATVLQIVSKNWDHMTEADRITIPNVFRGRTCIPTKQGMKVPGESYFPTVKLFADLPIIYGVHNVKDKVLTALGVRKTVELKLVFERLMSDQSGAGEKWSHVDLIKYLTGVQDDIPSEDIRKLQSTAMCKTEPGVLERTGLWKVSELYNPTNPLRQLRLPILQWPGEWNEQSREAKFLLKLGLKRYPPEEVVINLASSTDMGLREKALLYFVRNFDENNYSTRVASQSNAAYLPLAGTDRLCRPYECFSSPTAALLGYSVLRSDLHDYASKFGVQTDPPIKDCCARLKKAPPVDKRQAKEMFEYFGGRLKSMSVYLREELATSSIVPVKTSAGVKHIPPKICYIGESSHKYASIFDFVDFGPAANNFLMMCGSKPEPTTAEIAYRLANEPVKLYEVFQSASKYLGVLRSIATEWDYLKKDPELVRRLSNSACLGAYKDIVDDNIMDSNPEEDSTGMREFSLAKASEIMTLDDITNYNIFKGRVLVAPEEEILENFYRKIGSTTLTSNVQESYQMGNAMQVDSAPLLKTILERSRLFLHNNTTDDINHDARWLEKNLDVSYVQFIKHKRVLSQHGIRKASDVQNKTAALIPGKNMNQSKAVILYVTRKFVWYDVAVALVRTLVSRPKPHSSLLLDSLLSTDLLVLRARGYNVDRILRAKKEEARLADAERLRRAEEQQKELERREEEYQEQIRQEQIRQEQQQHQDKQRAITAAANDSMAVQMPGAFADSPDNKPRTQSPAENQHSSFFSRGLNRFSKLLSETEKERDRGQKTPLPPEPSSNEPGPVTPRPDKPPVHHVQMDVDKPTPSHQLTTNLHRAIQSGRPHDSNKVFSPPTTYEVKESSSFCDSRPGQDIVFVAEAPMGIKFYVSRSFPEAERSAYLTSNAASIRRFATLLKDLAVRVFNMDLNSMHMYYDPKGSTIAFNLQGSLFMNIKFFLENGGQKPKDAVTYWFVTVCHELAHNIIQDHGSGHSFYTETFVSQYFERVIPILEECAGPPSYEDAVVKN